MKTSSLYYKYPPELVATKPSEQFRILYSEKTETKEILQTDLINQFEEGDVLVINNTQVVKRKLTSQDGVEVLFVKQSKENFLEWDILCPSKKIPLSHIFEFPYGMNAELIQKGLPQRVRVSRVLTEEYFERFGDFALPPYITKARRGMRSTYQDRLWYLTHWGKYAGSCAAPTASLHFTQQYLENLEKLKKISIVPLTLHVGIGTFLPVKAKSLDQHIMHKEFVFIPEHTIKEIFKAKSRNKKIWALGTTVVRALEAWGMYEKELFKKTHSSLSKSFDNKNNLKNFCIETDIFIYPPFDFKVVDVMMTNFHQPESTLLALVMAFFGEEKTLEAYEYAISKKFRLFSYGDLSVWRR